MADLSDEIENRYEEQLLWAEPINYKGVVISPVLCKDILRFNSCIYVLLYDPLRYNSEISTLPRLYFLTDVLNHFNDSEYLRKNIMLFSMWQGLNIILDMTIGKKYKFNDHNGRWFLRIETEQGGYVDIKANDFEWIRQIILHQNSISYDDTFVHEDIRRWIAQQEKVDNSPRASTEDYLEAFILETGCRSAEELKNIPLRRFNRIVDKSLHKENYLIQATAAMSGFVTFKSKIEHWLVTDKKNSIYDKYFKEVK